ncbi:Coq4 family protein [Novosphingobium sp.]|uniref:Coq4 family protein n=1 Tax=Novosphingobium sp. TaxID=1874826 RepID=UPI003BAA1E66
MIPADYIGLRPDLPVYSPARPAPRQRPIAALRHFADVARDKDDTAAVFRVFDALPWTGLRDCAERFAIDERLRRIRAEEPWLPAILDDHERLRRMPLGSLAHAYCDFMERENLSAHGLVEEYEKFAEPGLRHDDLAEWTQDRTRDTHDLLHVLTGYGRDALGEACVLAFTYGQEPSLGNLFIAYPVGLTILTGGGWGAPVLRAIREGQRLGRNCRHLIEESVLELLPLRVSEVRQRLGIGDTVLYNLCHQIWRSRNIDPYALMAGGAAA